MTVENSDIQPESFVTLVSENSKQYTFFDLNFII